MEAQDPERATNPPEEYALTRGHLALEPLGLRHPRSTILGGRCLTPYEEITDLAVGRQGLRLASRAGVFFLRRKAFRRESGPEALARALLGAIVARPGGSEQLVRMQAVGERAARAPAPRLSRALAGLCIVAFLFQIGFAPDVELAGMFSATLVSLGEYWRLVTANWLHGGLSHLVVNVLCLVAIGGLAERSLGLPAAAMVTGTSALGAMGGSWLAGYEWALGASGIVTGFAGALLALELRHPEVLPAAWRLPRRTFLAVVVAEAVFSLVLPFVAHAAHAGGFVVGFFAALATGPAPALEAAPRASRGPWLAVANAALAVLFVAGSVQGVRLALEPGPEAIERRAAVLLEQEEVSPWLLNNEAWRIATAAAPEPRAVEVALSLAERAVTDTGRLDPNILDTLAEVLFVAGRREDAVAVIDEARTLAPGEAYFREQRRRFTGDRDPSDRPEPPSPLAPSAPPPRFEREGSAEPEGVRI